MLKTPSGCEVRPHPYPYAAAIAISSDLDGTRSADDYFRLIRWLNKVADNTRPHAPGASFANSLYFSQPGERFCYDRASESERAIVRDLVRSGHVDTLHSFGDDIVDPKGLNDCLKEISRHELKFPVWINHSRAATNIWSPRRPDVIGGDDPRSPVYHAGHWSQMGTVYFGRGQTTAVLGQDTWPNPFRAVTSAQSRSLRNAGIAGIKLAVSPAIPKWRRQFSNVLGQEAQLKDGAKRIEMLRSNWFPAGIRGGARPEAIGALLHRSLMERLASSGGASILYTHLGAIPALPAKERERLRTVLAGFLECCADLSILVRTTAQLLDFSLLRRFVRIRKIPAGGHARLEISMSCPDYLRNRLGGALGESGLTIMVPGTDEPEVEIRNIPAFRHAQGPTVTGERPGLWRVQFPLSFQELPPSIK
jgi:hypothetical protein